jgi:UDP-N-acetylglucosamine acyltransferase
VGLARQGFSSEVRQALKQVYQLLFSSNLKLSQAIARAREEAPQVAEVKQLLDFVEGSERGITT